MRRGNDQSVLAPQVVISGPAGSGKTTIAASLAKRRGWMFIEGDDLHPPSNRQKMMAGQPLTDVDRMPWLAEISVQLDEQSARGQTAVAACSALTRLHRDILRIASGQVVFAQLISDEVTLDGRVANRRDHFMPASLVRSQMDTLEPLQSDEVGVVIAANEPVEAVVDAVDEALAELFAGANRRVYRWRRSKSRD